MKGRRITISGEERTVVLEREGERIDATIDDARLSMQVLHSTDGELLIEIGGRQHPVPFIRRGDRIHFNFQGETWEAEIASPFEKKRREKQHSLSAPMPGSILRIHVTVGDQVVKGAALITLEAMKMEHQITSPHPGTIISIDCSEGEMVQPGVDLISVDPSE